MPVTTVMMAVTMMTVRIMMKIITTIMKDLMTTIQFTEPTNTIQRRPQNMMKVGDQNVRIHVSSLKSDIRKTKNQPRRIEKFYNLLLHIPLNMLRKMKIMIIRKLNQNDSNTGTKNRRNSISLIMKETK